jgi:hypothetical protein
MNNNDGKIIVTFDWLQGFFNVKAIMRRFKAKSNELEIIYQTLLMEKKLIL